MRIWSLEHLFQLDPYTFSRNPCPQRFEDFSVLDGGSSLVDERIAETTCETNATKDTKRIVLERLEWIQWRPDQPLSEIGETKVRVVFDEPSVDVVEKGVDRDISSKGVFFGCSYTLEKGSGCTQLKAVRNLQFL
jgi:hypothetical protein